MKYTFNEYCEIQALGELILTVESIGLNQDLMNQSVSVLLQQFFTKLGEKLPNGLMSIGLNAMNKAREFVTNFRYRGQQGIDPTKPVDLPLIQNTIKYLGMRGQRNDLSTIHYSIDSFNKMLARFIQPGTTIAPSVYYQQLKNHIQNPSITIDPRSVLTNQGQEDPQQILKQVANRVAASSNDPQVQAAVRQTLQDLLTEPELRLLTTFNRATSDGKTKATGVVSRYGYTNDDLSQELKKYPNFQKRYDAIQAEKRRKMAKFKKEREVQSQQPLDGGNV